MIKKIFKVVGYSIMTVLALYGFFSLLKEHRPLLKDRRIATDAEISVHALWRPQVKFGADREESWIIEGTVTNTSNFVAPVVDLGFIVWGTIDYGEGGIRSDRITEDSIEVMDLQPHDTREFKAVVLNPFPYIAKATDITPIARVFTEDRATRRAKHSK